MELQTANIWGKSWEDCHREYLKKKFVSKGIITTEVVICVLSPANHIVILTLQYLLMGSSLFKATSLVLLRPKIIFPGIRNIHKQRYSYHYGLQKRLNDWNHNNTLRMFFKAMVIVSMAQWIIQFQRSLAVVLSEISVPGIWRYPYYKNMFGIYCGKRYLKKFHCSDNAKEHAKKMFFPVTHVHDATEWLARLDS